MRTMFTSVTRIFRRRALSSPASETTTKTTAATPPSRKSRHELISEAHITYMEAHQQRQQRQQQRRRRRQRQSRREATSLPPSSPSPSSPSLTKRFGGEDVLSLSPSESLCLELRSVEESVRRYLNAPSSRIYASDSIHF